MSTKQENIMHRYVYDFVQGRHRSLGDVCEEYANHLKSSFKAWSSRSVDHVELPFDIEFHPGRKFVKVVKVSHNQFRSVHSFICILDHDKWKVGDILKAATWKQPAKNYTRANVFNKNSFADVIWTGL